MSGVSDHWTLSGAAGTPVTGMRVWYRIQQGVRSSGLSYRGHVWKLQKPEHPGKPMGDESMGKLSRSLHGGTGCGALGQDDGGLSPSLNGSRGGTGVTGA